MCSAVFRTEGTSNSRLNGKVDQKHTYKKDDNDIKGNLCLYYSIWRIDLLDLRAGERSAL